MKKFLSLLLCIGVVSPVFAAAPTVVDLAKKAKTLNEKRSYIQQALQDPQFNQLPETYVVAGDIEMKAFDDGFKNKLINPNDPSAQGTVLADELLAAYNYYLKVLELEQGQPKQKSSKDVIKKISNHSSDFLNAGIDYFNAKSYYPQAYDAFMIYGNFPSGLLAAEAKNFDPNQIANAFYNAGIAASQGGNMDASAEAFNKARLAGYEKPEATIYEIASWQAIAQNDENRFPEAQGKIKDAARFGIEKFGLQEPIFINNLINSMVNDNEIDQALSTLTDYIAQNPDVSNLYALRGFVYDRAGKDDLSEADYRKASSMPTADVETLKSTSNKLYRIGTAKLNEVEGNAADTDATRQKIKTEYFVEAQNLAKRAKELLQKKAADNPDQNINPNDPVIDSLLESIDYSLTTFFN